MSDRDPTPASSETPTRTVGRRAMRGAAMEPSAQALRDGFTLSVESARLSGGRVFFPRGVFRYRSHDEANAHIDACRAEGMARLARERGHG